MSPPPPDFVQTQMPGNRENPRRKLGGSLVTPRRLENPDKHILSQVLRLVQVTNHPIDQIDDGLLVFLDQLFKSLEVSVFDAEHKRGIGVRIRGHFLYTYLNPARPTRFRPNHSQSKNLKSLSSICGRWQSSARRPVLWQGAAAQVSPPRSHPPIKFVVGRRCAAAQISPLPVHSVHRLHSFHFPYTSQNFPRHFARFGLMQGEKQTLTNNMTTTSIKNILPTLIAALAISTSASQAGEDTGVPVSPHSTPPSRHLGPLSPLEFPSLATDEQAENAWLKVSFGQPQIDISFHDLPLRVCAETIAKQCSNQFDLIMPTDPDPNQIDVKLELKNLKAPIEFFNAMNLYFQVQNVPARWKLTLNGQRPTAILGIDKPQFKPSPEFHTVMTIAEILYPPEGSAPLSQEERHRRAGWISGEVGRVLNDIQSSGGPAIATFKVHEEAGLLVFSGTAEETQLVHNTLEFLNLTMRLQDRNERAGNGSPGKPGSAHHKQFAGYLEKMKAAWHD